MKNRSLRLILFVGVALNGGLAYGQGSLGAIPKRPRALDDYKTSTLKEIVAEDVKGNELLPFRVRVVYTAFMRPISTTSNDVLHRWAQCCAGNPDHYTRSYLREMQFVENGAAYWLGVQDRLVADFQAELRVGEVIDLFLIRVSAGETNRTNTKRGSVLLVERFQRVGKIDDQTKESVDWIRSNLPSYAEKDLKVEVPRPCQLRITDSSKNASLSKAVVIIPLTDLDLMKVSVLSRQSNAAWDLWLHTTAGKRSILFMLYQGGPAEGGQASKYSLTFRDREKAEAVAKAFRRAINSCALARALRVN